MELTASATNVLPAHEDEVLSRLVRVARTRGLDDLAEALVALNAFVAADLTAIETELAGTPTREDLVGHSARHLLDLEGKRLRPLCVSLASRLGSGWSEEVLRLAAAVELVHSATLLHDDVVDSGDQRRGKPTARIQFGNAASVFAGDYLLVQALKQVRRAGIEGLLDRLLDIIDEMIQAEAVQLEQRGRLRADRSIYFHIVEGKTASLFRWAMIAGGRAGGLDWPACEALARFGNDLGMAFQVVDDALDLDGDESATGKSLFSDLVEGKLTFPLLVGLERDPGLHAAVEEIVRTQSKVTAELSARILESLRTHGAIDAAFELAREFAERGRRHLERLPPSSARDGLELVAQVAVNRRG